MGGVTAQSEPFGEGIRSGLPRARLLNVGWTFLALNRTHCFRRYRHSGVADLEKLVEKRSIVDHRLA